MREEKKMTPTPTGQAKWVWPTVYIAFALLMVGLVWGYNAYIANDTEVASDVTGTEGMNPDGETVIETNGNLESMKYPFDEALLDRVTVLQDFYDMTADAETRENSLLVFNQTYMTNSGVTLAVDGEPFEVLAAMSGTVEEVVADEFIGNEISIKHENGLVTKYRSVAEIQVQKGDTVSQGQVIGTAIANEWNPTAGVHLSFEVIENGEAVNPREFLAF
ncbi:M23 family metallopeptidase [Paenisporosarcina cavernae]|uniref:M23 family metallopeptidase n=1 Tax=Paenisporosarcina cavernae TaxID=2320858 RepID=A0A385YTE5_9BACL|nr:M23 family metallopeptidase [Paenisporosarcina cavernae]AYC28842.1 M23 family metallopeptidase [Paenisporosarcina cavernae]